MAITTRYFSTAAAGDETGSSWANRAILFTGGAWSTVISGFDFSGGANALLCYIGPGTYTITDTLDSGVAGATDANPLTLHGCDSSGVELTPPDPDWVSAAAPWDDSGLPVLATTTGLFTINNDATLIRLIHLTASALVGGPIITGGIYADWCSFDQSSNNATTRALATSCSNCIIAMTAAAYNAGILSVTGKRFYNIRVDGVTGSSGNRDGISIGNSASVLVNQCTFVGHGGNGITGVLGGTGAEAIIHACSCVGNGGGGIQLSNTASQTLQYIVTDCLCTGNGEYGLEAQASNVWAANNRFRDNTSGASSLGNYTSHGEYITDTDDATEFVDAAGGDYRIVNSALTWGKKYGAGDGPAAGGGGGGVIRRIPKIIGA